mmetsp:Transcript_13508/g.32735  ORF Transcript_13508/g.32735 Transcript_13508/m.32735 type:complete len:92 (-) Transcript_13508:2-277(-)
MGNPFSSFCSSLYTVLMEFGTYPVLYTQIQHDWSACHIEKGDEVEMQREQQKLCNKYAAKVVINQTRNDESSLVPSSAAPHLLIFAPDKHA